MDPRRLPRVIRTAIVALGAAATVMALEVQSVQALWFFTSDLIFVLLFPQLAFALFDRKVNRVGSVAGFALALVLRLGGGEPLFGVAPLISTPSSSPPCFLERQQAGTMPPARCCFPTRHSRRWPAPSPCRSCRA